MSFGYIDAGGLSILLLGDYRKTGDVNVVVFELVCTRFDLGLDIRVSIS